MTKHKIVSSSRGVEALSEPISRVSFSLESCGGWPTILFLAWSEVRQWAIKVASIDDLCILEHEEKELRDLHQLLTELLCTHHEDPDSFIHMMFETLRGHTKITQNMFSNIDKETIRTVLVSFNSNFEKPVSVF